MLGVEFLGPVYLRLEFSGPVFLGHKFWVFRIVGSYIFRFRSCRS